MTTVLPIWQKLTVIFLIAFGYYFLSQWKARRNLPPGPKPLPIVGNIKDLPPAGMPEYLHWIKFKDRYGPVSSITVLGTTMVILHSPEAAQELLSKKSTKTSNRPSLYFANEMCGFGGLTPNLSHNAEHRLHRKLMHQEMGTKTITQRFYDIQDVESRRFLLRVLDDPSNLIAHIKTEASAIILKITYGYSIEPYKIDPLVRLIEHMMDNFSRTLVPKTWMVDIIPVLKHLPPGIPGVSFQKTAKRWKEITRLATDVPYSFVLRQMSKRSFTPSYVSSLVKQYGEDTADASKSVKLDEKVVKNSAAIIYGGGADTTVSTMSSFVLAMVLFQDAQKKAQKEIDTVVGVDRLPEFRDREQLPYVNALVKETLRWHPVTPIGTTHVTDEELTYGDYTLPKGTYLLPCIWWFLHDPQTYPNPSAFEPERFLEPRCEPDPANHTFGYGRRVCPGRHLADDNLFLTISRLLATFDIRKVVDERGNEIDAKFEATAGLISHPVTFPYSIKPRSDGHAELIRRTETDFPWEESDAVHLEMNDMSTWT